MKILSTIQSKLSPKGCLPGLSNEIVLERLKSVIDPDLNKDIVSLGFVKNIAIEKNTLSFDVELTTPACPVKELLKQQCIDAVQDLPGLSKIDVRMTAQTRGQSISKPTTAVSLGKIRNIVAVASGKGGVGKSTTAVNLAVALAKSGAKVGVLDADIYGPSIPIMMRPENPTEMNGQLVVPPVVDGIKVISVAMFGSSDNAAILRGPMAAQIIKQFLSQVDWGELDYLIIDYPPGTGDIQLTLSQMAPITGAVVVTTPQDVALADVKKAVSMFGTMKVPVLGIVENMSYFICDQCDKKHHIYPANGGQKIADTYGLPLLAQIPIDPSVAERSDKGTPIAGDHTHPLAKAYATFAGETARHLSIQHANQGNQLQQFSLTWKN